MFSLHKKNNMLYYIGMKAMGIDFGLKRIGVAFSDETKFLATPYEVYVRQNPEQDLQHFVDLINKNKVDEVVCGLPMNMQGDEQEIADQTREFMDELQAKVAVRLSFVDERLSSVLAEDVLKQSERDWRKRKQKLDAVAASIILQDYLDNMRRF